MTEPDGLQIDANGWRQGSFVPPQLFASISEASRMELREGEHVLVVVSQDCDVVQESFDREPTVELIRGTRIDRPDGNFTRVKNPRRLHVKVTADAGQAFLDFSIHHRVVVDRKFLLRGKPEKGLSLAPRSIRMLADWIARRYVRPAFPNAFNRRLNDVGYRKTKAKIRQLLEDQHDPVSGIYLRLSTEKDLPVGETYRVLLFATIPTATFDDMIERTRIEEEFLRPFAVLLASFPGIHIESSMLVAEANFSLEDIAETLRLEVWDDLSYS